MSDRKQIFCLSHVGGSGSFFKVIEDDLHGYDVVKLEYAGHGERYNESLYDDFDELADDMYDRLSENDNGQEYALFGYSMGCISVLEILKRIKRAPEQYSRLKHIFLAAHLPVSNDEFTRIPKDEIAVWAKEKTIRFGKLPDKLINSETFWKVYLPIYIADYMIIGKYRFENFGASFEKPATVFYSETDTRLEEMKGWRDFFIGDCEFVSYEGSHFFVLEHHEEMSKVICRKMN